jgi:hypothetical protein
MASHTELTIFPLVNGLVPEDPVVHHENPVVHNENPVVPYVWPDVPPFVFQMPVATNTGVEPVVRRKRTTNLVSDRFGRRKKEGFISGFPFIKVEFYQNISASLTEMPNLMGMENLRTLELSHNEIRTVSLPYDCKITHLFLNHNRISHIASLPKNLILLDISHNEIRDNSLGIVWDRFQSLVKITMSYNKMTTIMGAWPPHLIHLDCSHNLLKRVDILCPELKILDLQANHLETVVFRSRVLRYLNLRKNESLDILPALAHLNSLKHLDISYTGIQQLDDHPDSEYIEARPLDCLPDSIEILEMNHTSVDSLPRLPYHLKRLSCTECGIETIQGLEDMLQLTYLNCSYNDLVRLPIPESLHNLVCHNNRLTHLEIPYKSQLKTVDCSNNWIRFFEHIPAGIQDIRQFICHKNPFFFAKPNGHFRNPLSVSFLRSLTLVRNIAHIVARVVGNPDSYKHLIGRPGGAIFKQLRQQLETSLQGCSLDECPVCYTAIGEAERCITRCFHCFCMTCADRLDPALGCPMCRDNLAWKHMAPGVGPRLIMDCPKPPEGIVFSIHRVWETLPDNPS